MLFFAIVYAVEGIGQARVGIILQPLTNYLKTHGWTPLEVTAYFGVLNFPWVIKPVFGLISDFVPLFGYRRTSYLLLASAGGAVGYAGVALLNGPAEFALFLLLTSYAMATASTLCGALLAENGRTFQQSSLFVGQQWLWFYVAIMAERPGGRRVGRAPLRLDGVEGRRRHCRRGADRGRDRHARCCSRKRRAGSVARRFAPRGPASLAALQSRRLWLVAAFLFLYAFAPGFGTPLYYYMTDTLRFSQSYIGALGSIASAGWIAGALLHLVPTRARATSAMHSTS